MNERKDKSRQINLIAIVSVTILILNFLILFINNSIVSRMDRTDKKIDDSFVRIEKRIDNSFALILEFKDRLLAHLGWHKGKGDKL